MKFFTPLGQELINQGLVNKINFTKTPYQRRLLNQRWINEVGSLQVYKYQTETDIDQLT